MFTFSKQLVNDLIIIFVYTSHIISCKQMTFCKVFERLHWQKLFLRLSSSIPTKVLVKTFLEHGTT